MQVNIAQLAVMGNNDLFRITKQEHSVKTYMENNILIEGMS